MKIRTKLTLVFFAVVIVILSMVAVSIYYFFADYRENDFYRRLKNRAINTANLLTRIEGVGADLLRKIDTGNPANLPEQFVVLFDDNFQLLYSSEDRLRFSLDTILLREIRSKKELRFTRGKYEAIGFVFSSHQDRYIVVAEAYDVFGYDALHNLRKILFTVLAISLIFVSISGWFYAGRFLSPISRIIHQVDNITEANLDQRLDEGSKSDEIDKLSQTFNHMLERLEESFAAQKNFISNASHELRTPIAVISAEIEAALLKTSKDDPVFEVFSSVLENTKSLSKLSTQLLLLAQTSARLPDKRFSVIRVDEILWDAKQDLEKIYPDYNIVIDFDLSLNDEGLAIEGDPHLVKIVFSNLIDNACKYSDDNQVIITLIVADGRNLRMDFTNSGKGIDNKDKEKVFAPFFRGKHAQNVKGYGIGLPLASRIVKLHHGNIAMESIPNSYTRFTVTFPLALTAVSV